MSLWVRFSIAAGIAIISSLGVFLGTRPATLIAPVDVPVIASDPAAAPQHAWASLIENPLAGEVRSLADEAESGVLFLVACLDVSPLAGDVDAPVE